MKSCPIMPKLAGYVKHNKHETWWEDKLDPQPKPFGFDLIKAPLTQVWGFVHVLAPDLQQLSK